MSHSARSEKIVRNMEAVSLARHEEESGRMIALTQGGVEVDLATGIGGAVMRFAFEGKDVLRPARRNTLEVLETGCFALVPFANRIEHGVLRFQGREILLRRNMGDHPHPLHGHGWRGHWRATSIARNRATITFEHQPDDWPWAYGAEQVFTLSDGGLHIRLAARSLDSRPMPISLGFHPYFPRTAETRLTASVAGMWKCGENLIPTEHVNGSPLLDLKGGARLGDAPFVDNCHTGWRSPARIDQPDSGLAISLEASPECSFFHTYVPVGENFFCAEPVSAMPNAFNRPEPANVTGARTLDPGESFAIEMRIGVRRR